MRSDIPDTSPQSVSNGHLYINQEALPPPPQKTHPSH